MNRKRTLIVVLTFMGATLIAFGTYGKRKLSVQRDAEVREIKRTAKGVLLPIRSTVLGVTVTGMIRPTGHNNEYEVLDLIIRNDTDTPVEALEVAAPPLHPVPGSTVTMLSTSQDKRRPQFPGDHYKLKPAEPLIGPHSQMGMGIVLNMVPDDSEIVVTAVGFSDGRVVGSGARDFARQRQREAKEGNITEYTDDVKLSGGKGTNQ